MHLYVSNSNIDSSKAPYISLKLRDISGLLGITERHDNHIATFYEPYHCQ